MNESLRRLWAWPVVLGVGTGFGLVCALVADGSWDAAGALCLAVPAAYSLWLTARRPRPRRAPAAARDVHMAQSDTGRGGGA